MKRYQPKWQGKLQPDERREAFLRALDDLGDEDRCLVSAVAKYVETEAKARGVRGLGEHGALELVAAVGMWLAQEA